MRQRLVCGRMMWGISCVVLVVALAFCSLARAAEPASGRWSGTGSGTTVDFVVSRVGGSEVLSDLVVRCSGAGGVVGDNPSGWFGLDNRKPEDRAKAAIGADGTIHPTFRTREASFESGWYHGILGGRLAPRRGTVSVRARVDALGPGGDRRCAASHIRVAPDGARLRRDGEYRVTGPLGTDGLVFVYGQGAMLELSGVSFGTPIGAPDPEFPEITCADIEEAAAIPAVSIFPNKSGAFATASAGPLGTATFGGKFTGAGHVNGIYSAAVPIAPTCRGFGPFTLALAKGPPRLTPAVPLHGNQPPPRRRRHRHRHHHHPRRTVRYVALGDSFSAGEGVAPYERGTATVRDRCHRSTRAYSRLVSLAHVRFVRAFYACSGARTPDVLSRSRFGEAPQLDHPRVGRAQLVTISIGGNDAGFTKVLAQCTRLYGRLHHSRCYRQPAAHRILGGIEALRGTLTGTFEAIRRRTGPEARIVVLDYPNLFPKQGCRKLNAVFDGRAQRFMRTAGGVLDRTLAAAAAQAHVQFVDVRHEFADHELCARHEWLDFFVRPRAKRPTAVTGSFHPNAAGQRAYARVLHRALAHIL